MPSTSTFRYVTVPMENPFALCEPHSATRGMGSVVAQLYQWPLERLGCGDDWDSVRSWRVVCRKQQCQRVGGPWPWHRPQGSRVWWTCPRCVACFARFPHTAKLAQTAQARPPVWGMNGVVTQRQTGSVERILGRSIRRHLHLVGPGAEAAGVVELRFTPFALAAGECPPLRD
jgi:hypothetical protein